MSKLQKSKGSELSNVRQNLDRNLAILGLVASLILTLCLALFIRGYTEVGISTFLACATYLAIRKRLFPLGITSLQDLYAKRSTYLILNLLFFILFFYSVISIILREDAYSRPLGYFISTALMATILALEILFLPKGKAYTSFILVKIMLIALSLRWIPQLIFPGLIGVDPWAHQMFTGKLMEAGSIPGGYPYSELPIMHLIIAATSFITDMSYKYSTMLSISLFHVIGLIYVFLLGRFIFNSKVGLLSALLLGIAGYWINLGMGIHPTTLALVLVAPIIYVILKAGESRPGRISISLTFLSFIFMSVLIMTHTLTALSMAVLLFSFWLGYKAYKRLYDRQFDIPVTLYLAILFTVAMFTWWMYVSGSISVLAEVLKSGLWVERWAPSDAYIDYWSTVSLSEYVLYMLGFLLFFTFSIIGSFYMLAKRFGNRHSFALILGGLVLVFIGFSSQALGLSGALAGRWWWNAHLIMAIPAAIGFLSICASFKSNFGKVIVLAILIFIITFFLITSAQANFDNLIYTKNTAARYAFTESELSAMNTVADMWDGKVGIAATTEYAYFVDNRAMLMEEVEEVVPCLLAKDFTECTDMIVIIREEIVNNYFTISAGGVKLDYDPREVLEQQGFDRIYDCGNVSAFSKWSNPLIE